MVMAEQVFFGDYEKILSGRGYIWSVTIPLLKDHLILGSGADTFITEFPQQDYLRLWRNGYSMQVMTKPHCLYLQVAVQDGVIAMLALITFLCLYLIQCVRIYINTSFENFYDKVGVGIMLAVLGYALMGLSNDSTVTVSPIFWAIAGVGIYVNAQCIKLRNKPSECVRKVNAKG